MAWTALTYALNSLLTAAKMTQNQDNFTALAQGLSGAPKILDAAIDATGITTRSKLPTAIAYEDEANAFTGNNTHAGTETFNSSVVMAGVMDVQAPPTYQVDMYDPTSMSYVFDDFLGFCFANSSNRLPCGDLGWDPSFTGSGSIGPFLSYPDHPGVLGLLTGTSTGNLTEIELGAGMESQETFDVTFVIRPNNSDSNTVFGIGMTNIGTFQSRSGMYFEKDAADTTWFAVCHDGSSSTRSNTSVSVSTSTWTRLRIRRIDASTVRFNVNGGSDIDITTNVPTTEAAKARLTVKTTQNSQKILRIDYFSCLVTGLAR